MSALGISVGNTVLVRYVAIIALGFLLFLYNRLVSFETYSNKEIEKVLHFFAFNLLLARDGRYSLEKDDVPIDQRKEMKVESIINQLQRELSTKQNIGRFYSKRTPGNEKNENEKGETFHLSDSLIVLEERKSQKDEMRTSTPLSSNQILLGETLFNPLAPRPNSE